MLPSSRYQPLDIESYEIRLLTLLPRQHDGHICCRFETVSLIYSGQYIALSYCWGDPNVTTPITVNDATVQITHNLADALRQLQAESEIRLWVDALCINQADRQELGLQVRLMKQIYAKASEVVAWVGKASDESSIVMDLLRASSSGEVMEVLRASLTTPQMQQNHATLRESIDAHCQNLLDKFFDRPYWKRVWIIQEVAVASRVVIQCGPDTILWDRLTTVDTISSWYLYSVGASYSYVKQISTFRRKVSDNERISLVEAIQHSQKALSTDHGDKIFALLGLCHDGAALVPMPNYNQPVEDMLRNLTVAMINLNKSMDILLFRSAERETMEGSPCWVPDWLGTWPTGRAAMYASPASQPQRIFLAVNLAANSETLNVNGQILGVVVALTDVPDPSKDVSRSAGASCPIDGLPSASQPSLKYYGSTTALVDAIWKSLTMSNVERESDKKIHRKYFSTAMSTSLPIVFWTTVTDASSWLGANSAFCIDYKTLEHWSEAGRPQESLWERLHVSLSPGAKSALKVGESQFANALSNVVIAERMRLAVLDSGIIGVVHPKTRLGNIVCTISGFSTQVVLRRSNGQEQAQYRIVGDACVQPRGNSGFGPDWGDWGEDQDFYLC